MDNRIKSLSLVQQGSVWRVFLKTCLMGGISMLTLPLQGIDLPGKKDQKEFRLSLNSQTGVSTGKPAGHIPGPGSFLMPGKMCFPAL